MSPSSELEALRDAWESQWQDALSAWSRFTKLSPPRWCFTEKQEQQEGLTGSFAMIRLTDQAVVISLRQIQERQLEHFGREIMAHEIGHHVYVPGNLLDQGRMIGRIRRGLPGKEHLAPLVANLYADLLLNDRLQRDARLDIAGVYQAIAGESKDRSWTFYVRIYEILWRLKKGTLARGEIPPMMEVDAQLGARLIRSYSAEWLEGAGRFAALISPYIAVDDGQGMQQALGGWLDTQNSAGNEGQAPTGLTEADADPNAAQHPRQDPRLTGLGGEDEGDAGEGAGEGEDSGDGEAMDGPHQKGPPNAPTTSDGLGGTQGQYREPFEYGAILKALGMKLDDHEIAVRHYRERAAPHLIRFPTRPHPQAADPLPEGLDVWDIGAPLEDVDWMQSVLVSPHVVPGFTTVQRVWGSMEGINPERHPVDLDLYIDCSGSMPNPQQQTSYLALAGAIIVLSAFRVGARVQATLWSGARQFEWTNGFISDADRVLRIATGYLGGSTAFPIHILRDTYQNRKPIDRPVHILNISDDGITTMFDQDEHGTSGWDVSRMALEKARGGGTMVLNLYGDWKDDANLVKASEMGWRIFVVRDWAQLVEFARSFSREQYEKTK